MFKVGDRVKFKTSSLQTGMIDANDKDVFEVTSVSLNHVTINQKGYIHSYHFNHLEHVKEEIMDNTEEQEIEWEVGQEVWCLIHGKGVVNNISLEDKQYPIEVDFGHDFIDYTTDGKYCSALAPRTLFFSEPKIEAEKFPPKKPFVPTLKFDDKVIVLNENGRVAYYGYVEKESEDSVSMRTGEVFRKYYFSFHELGEEIIFN